MLKPLFGRSSVDEFFLSSPRYGFAYFNGDFDGTFPSGHAAMAASFVAVLWHFYPRWRWLHAAFAIALMFSLVVTRDHFLSDVIAGVFIGATVGRVAARALDSAIRG